MQVNCFIIMKTVILFFIPTSSMCYKETSATVKQRIIAYFGNKHADVDTKYPQVIVKDCVVTEKDLDEISSRIAKEIELIAVVNPDSEQAKGRIITLSSKE